MLPGGMGVKVDGKEKGQGQDSCFYQDSFTSILYVNLLQEFTFEKGFYSPPKVQSQQINV